MNVLAINDVAGNGMTVQTTAALIDWDAERNAWRAQTRVGGATVATSHHSSPNAAKREAEKMHAAYHEVHAVAAELSSVQS